MSGPLYDLLLVAHVLCAVIGFSALLATGAYARAVRASEDPFGSEQLLRYFRPGHNLASFALYLVPLFGLGLILRAGHGIWSKPFVGIGLGIWLVAVGLATSTLLPAERAISNALGGDRTAAEELDSLCRRCEKAAGAIGLCFVGALFVMIIQPG